MGYVSSLEGKYWNVSQGDLKLLLLKFGPFWWSEADPPKNPAVPSSDQEKKLLEIGYLFFEGDLGGGNSNIFFIFIPIPGEMIQFHKHIFQMGWNHQPYILNLI